MSVSSTSLENPSRELRPPTVAYANGNLVSVLALRVDMSSHILL